MAIALAIAQFVACALIILVAGMRLSRYGDIIGVKTGLGGTWMGVLVMATVTSLPELITGASAILVFDVIDIAAGDAIGSCMFNLIVLAFLDWRHAGPLTAGLHGGHVLVASFGIVMLGLATLAMFAGFAAPVVGWVGLHSVLFVAIYVFAIRTIIVFERARMKDAANEPVDKVGYAHITLRRAMLRYAAHGFVLVAAAAYLPGIAEQLSQATGLDRSFVGSLFVAASTSMPEVVVTAAAARLGAIDMAVGNLFGSNLFNVAVLGVDDMLYTGGSMLATVSSVHLVSLTAAMTMTGIGIVGMTYRASRKRYRLSWDTLAIVVVYVLATVLLAS